LVAACGLLALAMALCAAGLIWWGYSRSDVIGIQAASIAVLIAWACATAALVLSGTFAGTPNALNATLGSIGLRTAGPILLGIVVDRQFPPLSEAGLLGMLVFAYLVALVVETLLALSLVGPIRVVQKAL